MSDQGSATATAAASAAASATSAAATPPSSASIRTCPNCAARMSCREYDPHVICTACRGKTCTVNDRCDLCSSWPEDKMKAYVKHQARLKSKRDHKKKKSKPVQSAQKEPDDFLDFCTMGVGSSASGVGDSDLEVTDDLVLSQPSPLVSVSVNEFNERLANLESSWDQKVISLRQEIKDDISDKFSTLASDLEIAFVRMSEKLQHSLTAPRQVPVDVTMGTGETDPPAEEPRHGVGLGGNRYGQVPAGIPISPFNLI